MLKNKLYKKIKIRILNKIKKHSVKYDFILRNFYFDDDVLNIPYGFCLKYETFRKSDIKQKYSYNELKDMLSNRRFIGIHLIFQ